MKMPHEYMAELHRFLYLSNDSSINKLIDAVADHLKYIPRKKLYRYRKCTDRELSVLENNAVWLADPQKFPDLFDATLPIPDRRYIDFDYPFFFAFEVAYKALIYIAEEGETIPDRDDLLVAMYETIEKYTQEEINGKLVEILGADVYARMRNSKLTEIDFSGHIERTKTFFDILSVSPRTSLAIASFTTKRDNRNMWENYTENYSGFCVEYSFADIIPELTSKNAWDVLHLLPVKYYANRPLFDYSDMLHHIVQSDMKLAEFNIDADDFLAQYYRSITAKLYDYRAEQEWRLIMNRDQLGKHSFPYVKRVYAGKDMSEKNVQKLMAITAKLGVPLLIQSVSRDGNTFEYRML